MPALQFYPIDITFKVVDGRTNVYLFGKTLDNKVVCSVEHFNPYIIVVPNGGIEELKEKIEAMANVVACKIESKKYLLDDVDVIKVEVNEPAARKRLANNLNENFKEKIKVIAEYDISFTKQFLFEKNITPFMLYEVEGELTNEKE